MAAAKLQELLPGRADHLPGPERRRTWPLLAVIVVCLVYLVVVPAATRCSST